jgi:MATE family multidrug resistance protein
MKYKRFKGIKVEASSLLQLAMPILLAQWALTGLGVVDTLMSGWVGTNDLAAIGLGSNMVLPVVMFSTGILLAITPLVAKANGQKQPHKITQFFYQGLWLALPLGFLSLWILMSLEGILSSLSLSDTIYQLTQDYLFYVALGLPAVALYQVLRFFWEGLGTTLPTMWISFFALFLNIPLNAIFIYGWGPIDALGAAGCGIATTIVMWSMLLFGLIYVFKSKITRPFSRPLNATFKILRPSWQAGIKPILGLGIPNTLAILFEVSLFSMIVLFIASLGAEVIASHQIALSFTSMAFMVPLSFAMALTVRVGYGFGQQDRQQIHTSLLIGFSIAIMIGVILALISYFLRFEIVDLYTDDPAVVLIATSLLTFAAMYQVFDAIQVTAAGALRGFQDTQVTMLVTFVTYWGIGLGMGYVLAFKNWFVEPMGVQGFWMGIVLGLFLAAILLPMRLHRIYYACLK